MYLPRHFQESNIATLHEFLQRHPLATLIRSGADGPHADHVPLLLDPKSGALGTLKGHVARTNPLWREAGALASVLAVFQDAGCYVSPSWYPSKRVTGKVVPTWNYIAVHVHGGLEVHDDAEWLRRFLTDLTRMHESGRPEPWTLTDAPADYIEAQLRHLVGIELRIERIVGKYKLSQNRSAADADGVARGLRELATPCACEMARMIEERRRS